MGTEDNLKQLPLDDLHKAANARFGGFAGWSMPITYPLGVMKEHLHTREKAGLFDISHMQLFDVAGPQAAALLSRVCPLDASALQTGQSKYTFFLNDKAGILDDLIVTRLGDEHFMVVANAGNAAADEAHLRGVAKGFDCKIDALDRVFLAIQGPQAVNVLRDAGIAGTDLAFMNGFEPKPGWFMSRSGYTGEDGFEISVPADKAEALVTALLDNPDVLPIGLGARDSLRLEAGLCLYGHDIDTTTTPVEGALEWSVQKVRRSGGARAGGFPGADRILAQFADGAARRRVGLKPDGRAPVREGAALFADPTSTEPIGKVTSGGFGPSLNAPVAMGYLPTSLSALDTTVFAEVRGQRLPLKVAATPFVPNTYKR